MNLETLERLWRSHDNDLSATAQAYLLEDMMKTLKNRRRQFHALMTLTGLWLLIFSGIAGWMLSQNGMETGREWGIFALLGVSWVAYIAIQVQHFQHTRRYPHADSPLPEALAALLDENRTARARSKVMLGALVVFVGFLVVALWQLNDVGKMEPRHVQQFALLAGGALGLSLLINGWRYFGHLKPEGARLQRLLSDYNL